MKTKKNRKLKKNKRGGEIGLGIGTAGIIVFGLFSLAIAGVTLTKRR